jgi:hypothetical protein
MCDLRNFQTFGSLFETQKQRKKERKHVHLAQVTVSAGKNDDTQVDVKVVVTQHHLHETAPTTSKHPAMRNGMECI